MPSSGNVPGGSLGRARRAELHFDRRSGCVDEREITSFNNVAARDRFIALQGLPLSGGDDILVGESSQPLGVSWGFSAAAAIDPAGRVAGVLTGAEFRDRLTLELGSILDASLPACTSK